MIAIDITYIKISNLMHNFPNTGVDCFLKEMLDGFEAIGQSDKFILYVTKRQQPLIHKIFPNYKTHVVFSLDHNAFAKPFLALSKLVSRGKRQGEGLLCRLNHPVLKAQIKRDAKSIDLIWHPHATPHTIHPATTAEAYTVHDIIPVHYNQTPDIKESYRKMLQRPYVITISEFVKQDIMQTFGEIYKGICVVPNPITVNVDRKDAVDGLAPKKFILDINSYDTRKNPTTLIRAFEQIADQTDMDLVFCGYVLRQDYFDALRAQIEKSPYKDRIHTFVAIPTEKRNWLLTHCALLVTPSLDEGFGRTPIEAAICKIPVLSTKCTSLFEVTQGLLHYVENPTDPNEYALQIMNMIQLPDSHEKLSYISEVFLREYSLENCASMYLSYFESIIPKKP